MVVFVHGSSRDDKLWPEACWIGLGKLLIAAGWRVALPHAGADERERAGRIAAALGDGAEVLPSMGLGALIDRMAASQGVIGVDSGPSHLAVALDLPHVQIYNHPTAWRTGPLSRHGHRHQEAVETCRTDAVDRDATDAEAIDAVDTAAPVAGPMGALGSVDADGAVAAGSASLHQVWAAWQRVLAASR